MATKSYGQFCPVAKAAELFCERWTALMIRDLATGPRRFSELKRGVPLMSPTLLSTRLKQLEAEDIIERRRAESGKTWLYGLTRSGQEFVPLVEALGVWGQRWTRRALGDHELDLGLLVWGMENGVAPEALGPDRTLIQMDLEDQPRDKRSWWFDNDEGVCRLCVDDPGYGVDLYLTSTLESMTYIWRGDLSVNRALTVGRLEVQGSAKARKKLRAWLNLSPLTQIRSQREDRPRF